MTTEARKTVLIATTKAPTRDTWEEFQEQVRQYGLDYGVLVGEQGFHDGPGCANYAMKCLAKEEQDIEAFANAVTMALFPSRWTYMAGEGEFQEGYHLKE